MRPSVSPQLIEIDPRLVKGNPANPRKHLGSQFLRLKKSVQDVGLVQFPAVRVLPGGFFECIDGEGRVQAARESHAERIWVVSFGVLDDETALLMLQAANVIRSFNLLAECRGLANLHRQGMTSTSLAKKFGLHASLISDLIAIGYFPNELMDMIQEDIARSEGQASRWTQSMLREMLHLRQERPGQNTKRGKRDQTVALESCYDYQEVQRAAEQVLQGTIVDSAQMAAYVTQRRLELYQERFDQTLQQRLERETAQAREALAASFQQQLAEEQTEIASQYQEQLEALRTQLAELEACHQAMIKEVAKRPDVVAQREQELQERLLALEEERTNLHVLEQEVWREAGELHQRLKAEMRQNLAEEHEQQRIRLEKEYAQSRAELETYYAQKDQKRQLQAEKTIRQSVAYGCEQLATTQQWILHLLTPGMYKGLAWLSAPEIMGLLAQIRAVRETLEKAEERLLHGDMVTSTERQESKEPVYEHTIAPQQRE